MITSAFHFFHQPLWCRCHSFSIVAELKDRDPIILSFFSVAHPFLLASPFLQFDALHFPLVSSILQLSISKTVHLCTKGGKKRERCSRQGIPREFISSMNMFSFVLAQRIFKENDAAVFCWKKSFTCLPSDGATCDLISGLWIRLAALDPGCSSK
jgi:hypothetical protein